MKKVFICALIMTIAVALANAQTKKVSILGDSYSTFTGCNPNGYAPFYPNDRNDVTQVSQTWWSLYNEAMGYTLEANDSWGGTTVCNTGYGRMNVANTSFNSRLWKLGDPDIIFVFGGTNDAWAGSPLGEYKYSHITKEDCKHFGVQLIELHDIEKQNGHPSIKGMKAICDQLLESIQ